MNRDADLQAEARPQPRPDPNRDVPQSSNAMANTAYNSGAHTFATGNIEEISTLSRRALFAASASAALTLVMPQHRPNVPERHKAVVGLAIRPDIREILFVGGPEAIVPHYVDELLHGGAGTIFDGWAIDRVHGVICSPPGMSF